MRSIITTCAITLVFVAGSFNQISAQYKMDYGFKVGLSNYLGEMGGDEQTRRDFLFDMKLSETRWVLGGFARYRINNIFAVNVGATYARIQGNDALSTNRGRRGRNLNFRNDFGEIYARAEAYFFNENDVGNRGRYGLDFQMFGFAGFSGVIHGPKTQLNGEWIKLRPLQTEGPDNKYGLFTFGLPVGGGFFFTKKRKHRFGMELQWTPTFTDYLDDVSTVYFDHSASDATTQALANRRPELAFNDPTVPLSNNYEPSQKRGDETHNDTYMFTSFTYSYLVRGKSNFYTQHYGWLSGRKKGTRKVRAKF